MARYTSGQVNAGGDGSYVSTSGSYDVSGYPVGGDNEYDAWVDFTLPNDYSIYKTCSVSFSFYANLPPASWDEMTYICDILFKVERNNSVVYNKRIWNLEPSEFTSNGAMYYTFGFTIDDMEFSPGDKLRFTFDGLYGRYISDTDHLYLRGGEFTSSNATKIDPIIPDVPTNALKRADTGYPLYYEGYVAITNAASLIGSTYDLYIEQTDLKTYYDVYHFPDTNKGDVEIGGVWFFRVRLSTSQDLTANPRTVIYNSDCPYRYPGKVYITTA